MAFITHKVLGLFNSHYYYYFQKLPLNWHLDKYWQTKTVWLLIFFKISYFMIIQVWSYMRMRKWQKC